MIKFIVKRLLWFVPILLVISLLAFVISVYAPGDPLQQNPQAENNAQQTDARVSTLRRKNLGLDLPVFYFTIETLADCDTVYRITDADQRNMLIRMGRKIGNPELTMNWYHAQLKTDTLLSRVNTSEFPYNRPAFKNNLIEIKSLYYQICRTSSLEQRAIRVDSFNNWLRTSPGLLSVANTWKASEGLLSAALEQSSFWKQWIPAIRFHGFENQYHMWLWGNGKERKGILRGDFGFSFRDGQAVTEHIGTKIKWTMVIMIAGLTLACLLVFFAGLFAETKPTHFLSKLLQGSSYAFWALPIFFIANLSLLLFANPDMFDWFPGSGLRDPARFDPNWPLMQRIAHYIPHLILPVGVYALSAFGFLFRQFSSALRSEMRKDYILAGRARGLSKRDLLRRHALRNALIPMVTLLGQYFPLLISGSVLLETIFSIPGMGMEIYESTISKDYPMIVALFTLYGLFTMVGYLLSDIGIALIDPRIRYSKSLNSSNA
jgi:peptide/nickel transport system permease protein